MSRLELTALEKYILEHSGDTAVTKRRRLIVVVSGLCFSVILTVFAFAYQSWKILLLLSLMYTAITVFEKVAYANAVLAYKSIIRKLAQRIHELDQSGTQEDAR
jgi:hypothetical protein